MLAGISTTSKTSIPVVVSALVIALPEGGIDEWSSCDAPALDPDVALKYMLPFLCVYPSATAPLPGLSSGNPRQQRLSAALAVLDIAFAVDPLTDTPMLRYLVDHAGPAIRQLEVLRVKNNFYDEATDLGAFAELCTQLRELSIQSSGLTSIQPLEGRLLRSLRRLDLCHCEQLLSLEGLEGHAVLEAIDASHTAITSLTPLRGCELLTRVNVSHCAELTTLCGLEDHAFLVDVDASHSAVESLHPLRSCPNLLKVRVYACRSLPTLEGLESHACLEEVDASDTPIESLVPLLSCPKLKSVSVKYCHSLLSLKGLERHAHLETICANECSIEDVSPLASCQALKVVELSGCRWLHTLEGLGDLPLLEELMVSLTAITSLLPLRSSCLSLKVVVLECCDTLPSLEGLEDHPCLEEVDARYTLVLSIRPLLRGCPALKMVSVCPVNLDSEDVTDETIEGWLELPEAVDKEIAFYEGRPWW